MEATVSIEPQVDDHLRAGRDALARHAWDEAFEHLQAADQAGDLNADGLRDLGWAAWWAGHSDVCVDARSRAFDAYLARDEPEEAALDGLNLTMTLSNRGDGAAANGWLAKVRRTLADRPESTAHSYLESVLGVWAQYRQHDPEAAVEHATRSLAIAERVGDREQLALALNRYGSILVWAGRVEEGLAMLDESMVAAVNGDLTPYVTGVIYCNMISACSELADYRRAGEWTEAAKRWCERQSINGFPGICRVHRAEIMRLRGAWRDAEAEARRAADELDDHGLTNIASAGLYEIGEIRLRMGDLDGAEAAFKQAHEYGRDPQPGLAYLRLAQGRPDLASAAIQAALTGDTGDRLHRARLLPAQVELAGRAGDLDAARTAADELDAIAEAYGSQALRASAASCRASVRMLEGDAEGAIVAARNGFRLWKEIEAPYEAARVRVLLAEIHGRAGDHDSALLELRAARAVFEELGAIPDARSTAASLEALEAEGTVTPRDTREVRTFMFTDIVGSTNLLEVLGDESWTALLRWHDAALRALFADHGGEEIDHTGDGFFVAFPDAARAVACAVAVQQRLAEQRREHGFALQVRIGLHGAEATRQAGSYRGKAVHEAARIGALATAGEILASLGTAELAGDAAAYGEPRSVELKGLAEPVDVVSIQWQS
jgi:class 3 adenylate cyclase